MGKLFIWALRAMLGLVAFAASVGPKSLDSNISEWLERLGWENVPDALKNEQIDYPVTVFALVALVIAVLPWASWWKHLKKEPVGTPDLLPEMPPTETEFKRILRLEKERLDALSAARMHHRLTNPYIGVTSPSDWGVEPKEAPPVQQKGNFNDGTINGNQNYYDRLPPRSVSIDSFKGVAHGVAPRAIVRPAEQEPERFEFSDSLVAALVANGVSAKVQSGYSGAAPRLKGVMIQPAENPDAELLAERMCAALQSNGLTAHVGKSWSKGDDALVLILIGANG